MPIARAARLGFGIAIAGSLAAFAAVAVQEPVPSTAEPTDRERAAFEKTVEDMRRIGSALGRWSADRTATTPARERERLIERARAAKAAATRPRVGYYLWREGPLRPLSANEVSRMLRPSSEVSYLRKLPTKDRWGGRFEWLGSPENLFGAERFAVRSAGPNGRFEGPEYPLAARGESSDEGSDDIVWADGEFVAWPRAADAGIAMR